VNRLPVIAFSVLFVASAAAFFIVQHLKVSTPLINGFPAPFPAVINPVDGTTCGGVNHRRMRISFWLEHRADDVDVYIVDSDGVIVRTLASGVHMAIKERVPFTWNGREDDGSFAPDGTYYIRVALIHQGRTVTISNQSGPEPVKIKTTFPHPRILAVIPPVVPVGAGTKVTIRYTGNDQRLATVLIYRVDAGGSPQLVKGFLSKGQSAVWNGLIRERPAPPGAYRIALEVSDAACNTRTSAPVGLTVS
jgi:hypothetical protein